MTKNALEQFKDWHKSRPGLAIFGVLELGATYLMGSRALSTGSYWEYGFTLILLVGGVQNIVRLIKKK